MTLRIVAVGKIRERYVAAALEDFRTRLRRTTVYDELEVRASGGGDPVRAMREESERMLRALEPGERFWLLDRAGIELSSTELAQRLVALAGAGTQRLTLGIAGTYGASDALHARADFIWSLSKLTLLHEWARAFALEQLYRAGRIARNEPYHH